MSVSLVMAMAIPMALPVPLAMPLALPPELFVFKDETYIQSLLCPICHHVVLNAVETDNRRGLSPACGHLFCSLCIRTWLAHKSACPVCRKSLNHLELKPALLARRLVAESKMHCLHRDEGCQWTGEVGVDTKTLRRHLEKQCAYHPCPCCFAGCTARVLLSDWSEHVKSCAFRTEACNLCQKQVKFDEMRAHLDSQTCPGQLVPCPNQCSDVSDDFFANKSKRKRIVAICHVPRHQLTVHLKTCPLEPMTCGYQRLGCKEPKRPRIEILQHLKNQAESHLQLTQEFIERHDAQRILQQRKAADYW